jgi:signal transduction histidine kinase
MLDNPILIVAPGRSATEALTEQVMALGLPIPKIVSSPQLGDSPQAVIDLQDLQTLLDLASDRLTLVDRFHEQVEMKSRLVAVVAHEFRNPLNAILFSSELLQRYGGEVTPSNG